MLNRRELLAASVALSLTAQDAAARLNGTVPATSVRAVTHFIATRGLAESEHAAQAAALRGANIVWLGADLTPVYAWLDLALRRTPFAVAGMTSAHDFFVLERLAWDRGLHTVRRQALTTGAAHAAARDFVTDRAVILDWLLEPRARH
jgi:hypothetical protein